MRRGHLAHPRIGALEHVARQQQAPAGLVVQQPAPTSVEKRSAKFERDIPATAASSATLLRRKARREWLSAPG